MAIVDHRRNPRSRSRIEDRDSTLSNKKLLEDDILILAPHPDDEVLACGGTILLHKNRQKVHCLFATDGSRSPAPLLSWAGKVDPMLPSLRRREAERVFSTIGIPSSNYRFLNFPDGKLRLFRNELEKDLKNTIRACQPAIVLAPFRFDVHPDHVTLYRSARNALQDISPRPILLEYFVYFRLRLLPDRDVRNWVHPNQLINVNISDVSEEKNRLLNLYKSQTEVSYDWQTRPILTADSIRESCSEPERFLVSDPSDGLLSVFHNRKLQILAAYLAERYGKRPKDSVLAFLHWLKRL